MLKLSSIRGLVSHGRNLVTVLDNEIIVHQTLFEEMKRLSVVKKIASYCVINSNFCQLRTKELFAADVH